METHKPSVSMLDETTVQPVATTPDEELDLDLDLEPINDNEDVEALKAQLEAERKARQQLTARAKKAEEMLKSQPRPQKTLTKKNEELDEVRSVVSKLELAERKRQFGYEHSLSPEEVDRVFQLNANPSKDILDDDFVKAGLAAIRAKKRVESNTPGSSTSAVRFAPEKPLTEMSADEKQKQFDNFRKERFGK